jgi:hypothetical protein
VVLNHDLTMYHFLQAINMVCRWVKFIHIPSLDQITTMHTT